MFPILLQDLHTCYYLCTALHIGAYANFHWAFPTIMPTPIYEEIACSSLRLFSCVYSFLTGSILFQKYYISLVEDSW